MPSSKYLNEAVLRQLSNMTCVSPSLIKYVANLMSPEVYTEEDDFFKQLKEELGITGR